MWSSEKNFILARVTVLGCSGVGKTALVVRYLTKRYIGDYISGTDINYKCELAFMHKQIGLQIVDTSRKTSKDAVLDIAQCCRSESDVLMLVYALDDVSSFHFVEDILPELFEVAPQASVLVVGNKTDLDHSSAFFDEGIRKLSKLFAFRHMRVSAKSSCGDAARIFSKSIGLLIKRQALETSASSGDLTIHNTESPSFEFKFPPGTRRYCLGAPGAKLPRRATVDSGLGVKRTADVRLLDRLPSVEDTIEEEDLEERRCSDDLSRDGSAVSKPASMSFSYRKRKKCPPVAINLMPAFSSDDSSPSAHSLGPKSAPLPANATPVFRFPDVSCAAEYRYASVPTSPDSCTLKRQNSFLNKIKGALTAVPQRLRSPK